MPIEINNPANTNEIVATLDETSIDALLGVCVVSAGQAQIDWAVKPQPKHGALAAKYVDALEAHTEDIVLSITKGMGKPLTEACVEVSKAISEAHSCIGCASIPFGKDFPSQTPGNDAYSIHRPRCVIIGIKDSSMGVVRSNGPSTILFQKSEHNVYRRAAV